jgi:hypothetical protein
MFLLLAAQPACWRAKSTLNPQPLDARPLVFCGRAGWEERPTPSPLARKPAARAHQGCALIWGLAPDALTRAGTLP